MSAPRVGDRVRVIAGQWTGWAGVVHQTWGDHISADLTGPGGVGTAWRRTLTRAEVETVLRWSLGQPPGRDEGSGAPVEGHAANGPQIGGKR